MLTIGRLGIVTEDGERQKVIIQRVGRKYGNGRILNNRYQVQVRRNPGTLNDARSPAQLSRREIFRAAVSEWQGMSDAERQPWKEAAKKRQSTGYNTFIRHKLTGQ